MADTSLKEICSHSTNRALLTFIIGLLQLCLLKGIRQSLILLYSLLQFQIGGRYSDCSVGCCVTCAFSVLWVVNKVKMADGKRECVFWSVIRSHRGTIWSTDITPMEKGMYGG